MKVYLLIHGLYSYGDRFKKLINYLEKKEPDAKFITFDLPLHGNNMKKKNQDFTKAYKDGEFELSIKRKIDTIIGSYNDPKITIVAHSFGSALFESFLIDYPFYSKNIAHVYHISPNLNFKKIERFFTKYAMKIPLLNKLKLYRINPKWLNLEKQLWKVFVNDPKCQVLCNGINALESEQMLLILDKVRNNTVVDKFERTIFVSLFDKLTHHKHAHRLAASYAQINLVYINKDSHRLHENEECIIELLRYF